MEKTTVRANQDNDLKYRTDLDDKDEKKSNDEESMNESTNGSSDTLEYFTE